MHEVSKHENFRFSIFHSSIFMTIFSKSTPRPLFKTNANYEIEKVRISGLKNVCLPHSVVA